MKHALPLLAAVVALGVTGCGGSAEQQPQALATQAQQIAGDAFLLTAIKAKLVTVDLNSATTLGVRVKDGVATLIGTVRDGGARKKVIAAARSVPGVKSVNDDLKIDRRVPDIGQRLNDASLTGRIAGAIFTQTGSNGVKVNVHAGVVTLTGNIVDPKVRSAAVDTARNTSGVSAVIDRMGS